MPLLPPCITHTPNLQPLYASTAEAADVQSVNSGTFISVNNTDPKNPIVNSTLVAGTGIAIANGVLNAISASTASTFVQSQTFAQVDLEATGQVNVLTINVPASAQRAKIFKIHLSGSFQYSDPTIIPVVFKAYCSTQSEASDVAAGDTFLNITNLVAPATFTFGGPAAIQSAGGGSGTWSTNECVFLVQNAAAGAVANLYFIMRVVPNDGTQSAGVLNDVNLTTCVEAFL